MIIKFQIESYKIHNRIVLKNIFPCNYNDHTNNPFQSLKIDLMVNNIWLHRNGRIIENNLY